MLDGQGGDETLLGYDSYHNMYLSSIPLIKNMINILKPSKQKLFQINLKYANSFKNFNYHLKRSLHKSRFDFLKEKYFEQINYKIIVEEALDSCSSDFSFQKYNMNHVIEKLLRFEDRNSMYHSVEARLPFLDHNLVELSLSLPLELKLKANQSKFILRESVKKILPKEVVYRTDKKGFEAPKSFWSNFSELSQVLVRESPIIHDMVKSKIPISPYYLWRFGAIAYWEKIYNVSV